MLKSENAYTPQISRDASFILRRLAWLKGKPMTKTLNQLIISTVASMNITEVCNTCKGTKKQCKGCIIKNGVSSAKSSPQKSPSKKG